MRKAGYISLLIGLALCGFLYGSVLNRNIPAARAEEAKSIETDGARAGTKWEYCALSRAGYTGSTRGSFYWISYFKETGAEVVEIEEKVSDQQGTQISRAIARLGDEGWEMIGQGDLPVKTGRFEAIYFKRPKP